MEIALIAVLDNNNGIGKNNKLLCHLPSDLKRFKKLTTGHTVVMGRKTFESLPNGALPNRRNIVLTRNKSYTAEGAEIIHSTKEVHSLCKSEEMVFIIGGEEIYKLFIEQSSFLFITRIHHQFEADAYFPEFDKDNWVLKGTEDHEADEKNKFAYSFIDYQKQRS